MKTQKGITLIALIITIIVLLIIAVVSIGAVQKSKIIEHAESAATKYNQAKVNEVDAISGYESLIDKYLPAVSKIEYYINEDLNTVQKVDRDNGTGSVYAITAEGYVKQFDNNFEEGEPTTESIEINVIGSDKTTNSYTLPAGAVPLIVSGSIGAYFHDNKLYGSNGESYNVFDLVTDKSKISEIESKIANIE